MTSIATYHVRTVNDRAAASGEKKFDLSEAVARFGDILIESGRSSRLGPVRSLTNRRLVSGSSQRGRVCARPDPAGPGVVEREAWGGRTVARWTLGANQVSRVRNSGCPLPLSALICGPDGGKTPRKEVEIATFLGNLLRG